jgi:hypothetical protein
MVELTETDRHNIERMPRDYHYYAVFIDGDQRSSQQKIAWMQDAARYPPGDAP